MRVYAERENILDSLRNFRKFSIPQELQFSGIFETIKKNYATWAWCAVL